MRIFIVALFFTLTSLGQSNTYTIAFPNAVQHEAEISATFPDIKEQTFSVRMSRTSPGRYAIHEFAKNVYNFTAKDSQGKLLTITRTNPYQWDITGHDGTVTISYTLFADRADGTYSQIDLTHAHLNIPATFMYAPSMTERPIEIDIHARKDLKWRVATQLKHLKNTTYYAPNFAYFMDSPIEVSNHQVRSFEVTSNAKKYTINFALHHAGTKAEFDAYFEKVKRIVLKQKEVFGELPDFDFNEYTFLGCYIANASRDGMEHRNSTILTNPLALADGGAKKNIGTVSHEFFHSWNVERIRPKSLEPFNFEEANMSGELWFAEGFTSYYTNLILCRAKIITPKEYVQSIIRTYNYVWNSPARQYFNPIEMSYQAPFVDAATSIDPVNRENMFISYYSYGSILGLALDLSLREKGLHLDDYMKLIWNTYGKSEKLYTITDLHYSLNQYAGKDFGDHFFNQYIYKSATPDYKRLLAFMGISLTQDTHMAYLGNGIIENTLNENPKKGTPLYRAGLNKNDIIIAIDQQKLDDEITVASIIQQHKSKDVINLTYQRFGKEHQVNITLDTNPTYTLSLFEDDNIKVRKAIRNNRNAWLHQ